MFRKVWVGLLGGLVILVGIILIPLPGPGWLIVFSGLVLLGREFPAARRASAWVKRRFGRYMGPTGDPDREP